MSGPTEIFDRRLLAERRRRAVHRAAPGADFLAAAAVDDLTERLSAVRRRFNCILDLGTPGPWLSERLAALYPAATIVRLDGTGGRAPALRVAGDEECLPFRPGSFDLVVSALAFEWLNDLPGTLAQIRTALVPDGLLLATLAGGETLAEFRISLAEAELAAHGGAAPRVGPFIELRVLGALLQRAGFALPVVDQDRLTVRYATMFDLVRDLRAMAATNVLVERDRRPLSRSVALSAAAIYRDRFADPDGRIRATFQLLSLSGWAPHESQQQPLRPGSARARLADALGTVEQRPNAPSSGGRGQK